MTGSPRFRRIRSLGEREGRSVQLCQDTLLERRVVLKSSPREQILHEASLLLAAPPGVAPELLGLEWDAAGHLTIVMEALEGETLAGREDLEIEAAPRLLQAACQCLIHLHRSGIQHMDIRPENLFLLAGQEIQRARLIDFGFARNVSGALRPSDATAGGTPAFMAPEVLKGWAFDHRADQYSLGVTWRALFPPLANDARWGAILERMCAASPAERFPDLVALRGEIEESFRLPPGDDVLPRLGGGPLQGREQAEERLAALLTDRPSLERILLTGRSGTGLARLALETALTVARHKPSAMRATSLVVTGDPFSRLFAARFQGYGKECTGEGVRLLCVVPDASPGLHWVPADLGVALRELFAGPRSHRFPVEPVGAEAFAESVAHAMGTGGGLPGEIGRTLHSRSGGDFRRSAFDLSEILGRLRFSEQGLACSCELDSRWLSRWRPPRPDPLIAALPRRLLAPLRLCARAGAVFPESIGRALLAAFDHPESCDALIDHGYLRPDPGGRLGFISPGLHEHATHPAPDRAAEIDAWLHARWRPDPGRPEEVLAACRRARSLGDAAGEREHLSIALRAAIDARRRVDIRLLAGPMGEGDAPPTAEALRRRVSELAGFLGDPWREGQLLLDVAEAFAPVAAEVALQVLRGLAEGDDLEVALGAQLALFGRVCARRDERACAQGLERLRALVAGREAWMGGYLDWALATHAFYAGRMEEAGTHAGRAAASLAGHDSLHAGLCVQILAIVRFQEDPREGMRLLEEAEGSLPEPDDKSRACSNLANMCQMQDDLAGALAAIERGVDAQAHDPASSWALALRGRRTWVLLEMGRVDDALTGARRLLERWGLRQLPTQYALVILAAGVSLHYRDRSRASLADLARVWAHAREGHERRTVLSALRYLCDALLDLEAWDLVGVYGAALRADADEEDEKGRTVTARLDALLAHAAGRHGEALERLRALDPRPAADISLEECCWFLFHRAFARHALARDAHDEAGAREAAEEFAAAEAMLAASGHPYPRERARLERARSLESAGLHDEAREAAGECVKRLRATEYRGLLARALRLRAELALGAQPGGQAR